MEKVINKEYNNAFNTMQDKSQNTKKLKLKLKLLQIHMSSNYDYGISMIIADNKIKLEDKYEFIKSYMECEYDNSVYLIATSSNITSNQKRELIKVYKDLKYDKGKIGIDLEEKLITMMACVKYDKESYMFKILSHSKLSTKKKIRLKKRYEKELMESPKELIYQ